MEFLTILVRNLSWVWLDFECMNYPRFMLLPIDFSFESLQISFYLFFSISIQQENLFEKTSKKTRFLICFFRWTLDTKNYSSNGFPYFGNLSFIWVLLSLYWITLKSVRKILNLISSLSLINFTLFSHRSSAESAYSEPTNPKAISFHFLKI